MRKILSILAAVGLTSTAASAVVACGNKSNSEVGNKTNLSDVPVIKALESKLTITGNVSMTADDAWASFSAIPGVGAALTFVGLEKTDFRSELSLPTYDNDGSLKITVNKEESKYSGSLTVKISQFVKTDLNSLTELNKTITGSADMTADDALQAFLAIEANKDLANEVEVKVDTFKAPGIGTNGSFTLEAISGNHKYTGEIDVTISGYTVALNSLQNLVKSIDGKVDMTADDALQAFLAIDANKDLSDEVQVKSGDESFHAPTNAEGGQLIVAAKEGSTKYTGSITVIIHKLDADAEVNTLSTNDDHKTTIITLSTEDSLRLGYIKKDGDKFVAGDKLPNGPLTTKIGESTITATFTPNFENGTVQVLLTIDTPSVNALSTNDDHKTTVITLSTEDSLRLGYIKKDGNKFVAGDKLPNGPLTTKIGESTITATFTPNFENGTVQVLLTIDTPTNN